MKTQITPQMIVRIWRTRFDPKGKDRLVAYANDVSLPVLSTRSGVKGVFFAAKDDQWITTTFWQSQADIDRLDDDQDYQRIVEGILALGVLGSDQSVETFIYEGGSTLAAVTPFPI
ncbi:hypothetical protein NAC44_16860 [Allorhizobium sp. BGMRC 0089]|uniref:hypothetical protein n=1 Tax=Allorhizobium sonneratiae TaxID=2934936 RepID=UPI0020337E59|nr:hypothetical protein [Allorhizobium sonneratiae]MCM2293998.1 hypothetical protein [Allorhizobium sonneratiae]